MRFMLAILVLLLVLPTALAGGKRSDSVERLKRAAEVFNEIMGAPDKGIPADLLDRSECVAIIPGVIKGGFVVGGRYGKGMVMCRMPNKRWSAPSFITVGGGSFGLQIGGQKVDVVMLIMNRRGMDRLIGDQFTLGADAAAAAGPVGRQASAETNARLDAEILTYSRARGLFAGVTLNGAVVKQDKDDNRDFYGKEIDAREILFSGKVELPAEAQPLAAALSRESPRKSK